MSSAAKAKSIPRAPAKAKTTSTNGARTNTVLKTDRKDTSEPSTIASRGKPEKKVYDAEQTRIKQEIEAFQAKLAIVRDKISLATKSGPESDRRNALRAELDSIRDQQTSNKSSRTKILDQIKALQDGIQRKNKDLQAAKSKIPFRNVAEIDAHIKNLEKQVESGNLKLAEEKRALQEIITTKRNRRVVEGFQTEQDSIEQDRAKIDELRKQLDDPAFKTVSERYDAIKAELDELKKDSDEAFAGRAKLFEERDNIQNEINILFNEKRESSLRYRDANDQYWNKVNEDRARRSELQRQQRAAEEARKKKEIAERILEEAQVPAYAAQIEDCQTLIDYFSGKVIGNVTLKSSQPVGTSKSPIVGVPQLEIRKVEELPEGLVPVKKKGEEEEAYFVGGNRKAKGKKTLKANNINNGFEVGGASSSPGTLNVPLPTLTAILSLSIPPPASNADLGRVVEDLKTKKAWFEANQERQTTLNMTKAQEEIQKLNGKITLQDALQDSNIVSDVPTQTSDGPPTSPAVTEDVEPETTNWEEDAADWS